MHAIIESLNKSYIQTLDLYYFGDEQIEQLFKEGLASNKSVKSLTVYFQGTNFNYSLFLLLEHIENLTLKGKCLQSGSEGDNMFLFPINLKKLNIQFEKINSNQALQIMVALQGSRLESLFIDA
jgi:hypothetical protein